jgi:hypothetical protein
MGREVVSASLIGVVTLIYMATAASFYMDGRPGMALAFLGYALANGGLIMEALK